MGKFVDLTGQRFGRLVVKERAENDKTHHTRWVCVCDCGNYVTVSQANLSSGNTQSCGCFRKENSQRNGSTTDSMERGYTGFGPICSPDAGIQKFAHIKTMVTEELKFVMNG